MSVTRKQPEVSPPFLMMMSCNDGTNHTRLSPGFGGPRRAGEVGILLVDLARHYARMFAQAGVCTEEQALAEIGAFFNAEWDSPTDTGEGTTRPN